MAERLSIRAYARSRKARGLIGGSPNGVHKAVRAKRIPVGEDGLIDPDAADAAWLRHTVVNDTAGQPASQQPAGSNGTSALTDARTQKEQALAEQQQLRLQQMRSELVTVEFMKRDRQRDLVLVFRALENFRSSLPPRIAAAGGGEISEIREVVDAAIERTRAELAAVGDVPP